LAAFSIIVASDIIKIFTRLSAVPDSQMEGIVVAVTDGKYKGRKILKHLVMG